MSTIDSKSRKSVLSAVSEIAGKEIPLGKGLAIVGLASVGFFGGSQAYSSYLQSQLEREDRHLARDLRIGQYVDRKGKLAGNVVPADYKEDQEIIDTLLMLDQCVESHDLRPDLLRFSLRRSMLKGACADLVDYFKRDRSCFTKAEFSTDEISVFEQTLSYYGEALESTPTLLINQKEEGPSEIISPKVPLSMDDATTLYNKLLSAPLSPAELSMQLRRIVDVYAAKDLEEIASRYYARLDALPTR